MQPNTLYFGDNLAVLREHFPDESVDLIYLDPPFNSKRNYNFIYREIAGSSDTAQEEAFTDTWTMEGAAVEYREVTESGWPEGLLIEALRQVHGDISLVAYLSVMARRLRDLHRVLKPTGSLWLHCDPTASHYLKMILDCIFGDDEYRGEVIWQRSSAHNDSAQGLKQPGRIHDTLLFYSRTADWTWSPVFTPYSERYIAQRFKHSDCRGAYKDADLSAARPGGDTSYPWRIKRPVGGGWTHDLADEWQAPQDGWEYKSVGPPAGRYWAYSQANMRRFAEEDRLHYFSSGTPRLKQYAADLPGVALQDIWADIPPINARAAERLGYPTQKPLALLERIINASSNEGDLVLDPFCGCGTAVVAAQQLGRRWCGIDITSLAVTLIRERLADHFPEVFPTPGDVPVDGLPKDVAGAAMLFGSDPYDFQFWALTLVGAHPPGGTKKRGADKGIDGIVLWHDGEEALQKAIVSVKGGKVNDGMLRDLIGTMEHESAAMGLFVTLQPPSKPMRERAALAGEYELAGTNAKFPRVQIWTVEELLSGRRPELPRTGLIEAHKAAREMKKGGQQRLFED